MELNEARDLAQDIMDDYLAHLDWKFDFDQAKRRFGVCKFRDKTISLSAILVGMNDRSHVEDTIRHEVAHALAGPRAGHGLVWKRACIVTGADPTRCFDSSVVETPIAPWRIECPNGHFSAPRHRRKSNLSCGKCYAPVVFVPNTDIGSN